MIRETTAPQDITWLKIDEVYPYECNNKIHKQPEITKIANSIKEFGWTYPILIDENNIVLAGHKRLLAAKQIGLTEVPTIRKDDLSDAQKRAYRIIDNKSSEESEYDPTNLTLELDEIKALDFDISKFINLNFDLDKIGETQDLDVQEDDYDAEPPAEPKTKYGDIYQLGNHRLMCGDSTKEEDVEKLMDGEKADMVFCDAPYGYEYKSNHQEKYEMLQNDDRILDFIPAIWGKMQDNCPVYEFCGWQSLKQWLEYFENTNLDLKNIIIWKKNNWSMGDLKGAYAGQYEVILYLNKGRVELNGTRDTDIWEFSREPPKIHPTMKPIDLIAYALNKSSKKGEIVLDCFGGSGSTLIACEQLNRKCYMMELDERYVQVIIDRYIKFTGKDVYRINSDGTKTNWKNIIS